MGRMLGSFDSDENYDRPDLNKCPDCQTYFATENCPICGKPCPDNMKAGARAPVKHKKQKKGNATRRVIYVDWYHSPWFILIMAFIFPIVALILLITSPHERKWKFIFVPILALYILSQSGLGYFLLNLIINNDHPPIDTEMTAEEWKSVCTERSIEEIYRTPEAFKDQYVKVTVKVNETIYDAYGTGNTSRYIMCTDTAGKYSIMIEDYQASRFVSGDTITVYGKVIGEMTVYTNNDKSYSSSSCIASAYIELTSGASIYRHHISNTIPIFA